MVSNLWALGDAAVSYAAESSDYYWQCSMVYGSSACEMWRNYSDIWGLFATYLYDEAANY